MFGELREGRYYVMLLRRSELHGLMGIRSKGEEVRRYIMICK